MAGRVAAVADLGGVAHAVATAVGLREVPDRPLADALVGFLRDKSLLLVVDNCEHVVDAVARFIDGVLRASPRAAALGWFWWTGSYHTEGRRWLDRTLLLNPEPTRARAEGAAPGGMARTSSARSG